MLDTLQQIDTDLLLWINGAHTSFLDFIMYWASDKLIWIPFYAWLLFLLYKNYGIKFLWVLPLVALLITGSDQISVLAKNYFQRLRPCHEPSLSSIVHLVNNSCGGRFGYVSSHAANSMGLAIFVYLLLPRQNKILTYSFAGYVLLIGYSRIYLAAHYPSDVIRGWILGILLGLIFAKLMQKLIPESIKSPVRHE